MPILAMHNEAVANLMARMNAAGRLELTAAMKADPASPAPRQSGGIARIDLMGAIARRVDWFGAMMGFTSSIGVKRLLETAAADSAVKKTLLVIDSPGGYVDASEKLAGAVAAHAAVKPIIAQVDGMAASGAYYAASQATAIYAAPFNEVGSIGVRGVVWDMSAAAEQSGIKVLVFDTGFFKSAGEPGTVVTEDQQAEFQRLVDESFAEFRKAVRAGRSMTEPQFKTIGDGRMFRAAEAKSLGLIDRVQSLDETIMKLGAQQQQERRQSLARAKRKLALMTSSDFSS